ncbi:MAG: chromophore lyase CpcT/CpeT [Deltaproteobacteria bacterium]|nr:chromophore lyase CpcT/CpeT [Deltaproteobacteria bacterium]
MRAHSSRHPGAANAAGVRRALCAAALAALILPAGCGAGGESLEAEAARLARTLAGRWDNQEQHDLERRNGAPPEALHERIHSIFAPVSLAGLSGNVLYVQQYLDDDPQKIYRQRIYHITADTGANAVRLDILAFPDAAAVKDAHENPALLDSLTADSLRAYPGCEVFWKRRAQGGWTGQVRPGACSFVSQRSGKRIVVEDDLLLTQDELWIHDRAHDESGALVYGNRAGIPHKLRRAGGVE